MDGLSGSPDAESEYDVFVSYAHDDDCALRDGDPGWVHLLVDLLEKQLRMRLPGKLRCFRDDQLVLGKSVPDSLFAALERSRTLLLVMSIRYLASAWCRSELAAFLDRSGKSVFIVEPLPTERAEWPSGLRSLPVAEFWQKNPKGRSERLEPALNEHQSAFVRCVNDLATDLADRLRAPEIRLPSKGEVWLAEPTHDVVVQWKELVRELKQAGWQVLPESQYLLHDHDLYIGLLRGHLNRAKLFVQLLGSYEGRPPDWDDRPFPVIQAIEAHSFSEQRGVPWLRWRSKGSAAAAEAGTAYSDLLNEGDVQEIGFGEFKEEVRRALKRLSDRSVERTVPQVEPAASDDVTVYVHTDEVDRLLAADVRKSLKELGVTSIVTPPPTDSEVSPATTRVTQMEPLRDCHGVILVYGKTKPAWIQGQYLYVRKNFKKTMGLLSGPPPKSDDPPVSGPKLLELDCADGFENADLSEFVERVRKDSNLSPGHA